VVREYHKADVEAIGADAVNQAIQGLVLATGYLKNDGIFCHVCASNLKGHRPE